MPLKPPVGIGSYFLRGEFEKMPWKKGERIPTNLIVGFLGSGKTTTIAKLIEKRAKGEHWSILINEFGTVSIDHALIESDLEGVAVEKLGGGCACCTMSFAFKPLLAQFIRRSKPDRLILEPSGVSHPAKVIDILRSDGFSEVIDLRNIICMVDPNDFDSPKWQGTEVFQDQVQLADIVVMNWTDSRDREQIDRCRQWVESFNPPKQLVVETSFGELAPELLDREFNTIRFPLFAEAHALPNPQLAETIVLSGGNDRVSQEQKLAIVPNEDPGHSHGKSSAIPKPAPGIPLRFPSDGPDYQACGWVFHVDDIFDRNRLIDFLGEVRPILRVKGVFRCESDWWKINRAKDTTDFSTSTYRRDSRLEIIGDEQDRDWKALESELLECLIG